MTDLRFYFDGTNGTPVNGEVLLDVMISKEEKPKDIGQLKFRYSDSFFLHSACSYDHELAIMSLGLTMSAFTYKADGDKHARAALHAIGCDDRTIESFRFDDQQSCADSCGYIIAAKKLPDDTFLIPVVIRSHCYGGEWVSNAHAVEEAYPDHAVGFKAAADGVYDAVTDYLDRRGFDLGRVKLWLCGYSRGGAVTNLLGARFTFESGIGKDNIFAYSFATPVTVFDRACLFTDNIFNIMSEMDIVPRMPLRYWALTRYGADMIVPCKARRGLGEYTRLLGQMQAQFAEIMGELGVEAAYVRSTIRSARSIFCLTISTICSTRRKNTATTDISSLQWTTCAAKCWAIPLSCANSSIFCSTGTRRWPTSCAHLSTTGTISAASKKCSGWA